MERAEVTLGGRVLVDEPLAEGRVLRRIKQQRFGRGAVAARAAGLLVVGFERGRNPPVHHEAHVGAVHAHPEGVRGDDEVEPAGHEVVLHVGPLGVGEPGVVGANLAADLVADEPRHVVALLPRADVDEARPGLLLEHGFECAALIVRRRRGLDGEGEVRPVEAGDDALGVVDVERGEDVVLHERRRRGREGDGRRVAHVVAGAGDLEVVGPEVVAPLADAVRLVHGEERDAGLGERAEERLVAEPLGRDVDEPDGPAPQRVEPGPLLLDRASTS